MTEAAEGRAALQVNAVVYGLIDLLILGIAKGIRRSSHLGLTTRTSGAFQLIVDAECPVLTVCG
jgi:hypothetical protein